jgi:hypothetical protein
MSRTRWNKATTPKPVRVCELEDGTRLEYDAASTDRNAAVYEKWEYLGKGKIFSIDDVRQIGLSSHHFFKRPSPKEVIE